MTIPLAFVSWRGIERHMEVSCTVTHGLEPSRITISIPPDPSIAVGGTLVIRQGSTFINFFDCRADIVDEYKDSNGLTMWTVTILDRRWKWKFGEISGFYNTRVDKTIRKGTERTIKQLMQLCLEAMGEQNYDLSTVPTTIFPEVEWDYANPASCLASLADIIGYRVVFQLSRNRVAILKAGEGRRLTPQNCVEYAATYDPPELPTELRFIGSRTLWETDLVLEPIAEDTDHSIKSLNDATLSYRPRRGPNNIPLPFQVDGISSFWSFYDPEMGNVIGNERISLITGETSVRDFAKSQVYKRYRITHLVRAGAFFRPMRLPHPNGAITLQHRRQILPLLRERLATYQTELGVRAKPAIIYGQFDAGSASQENNIEERPIASSSGNLTQYGRDGSPPKRLVYTGGWNLDADTGIVTFSEPVYRTITVPYRYSRGGPLIRYAANLPAILWLRTSFGIRDAATGGWKRWEIPRRADSRAGTKPLFIKRDDVPLAICVGLGGAIINIQDATQRDYQQAANFYLGEAQKSLTVHDPVSVTYPVIRLEDLDGAIQQVSWQITSRGAFTKVSRNREDPTLGYSYAEQRLFQQVAQRLEESTSTTGTGERERGERRPGRG